MAKKVRRLKATEIKTLEKALQNGIVGCTKIIDSKDTIVFNDGKDVKKEIKGLRNQLIHLNNLFGWNVVIRK